MRNTFSTISAISTPPGNGGIAVLRVSGEESIAVVNNIFSANLLKRKSHRAVFGRIIYHGKTIDEVVVTLFRAPRSYTGEDVVEISCHGSMYIAQQILDILLENTRLAAPGEFTQRAFLNEKMGLTQAEAVGDLLTAKTKNATFSCYEPIGRKLTQPHFALIQKTYTLSHYA